MELIAGSGTNSSPTPVAHDVLFYEDADEYIRAIVTFVRGGAGGGEPALVAVPRRRGQLLRTLLEGGGQEVAFSDMTDLGRNPARILAALRRFVHAHPRTGVRFVAEPVWPGTSTAERREVMLHEALVEIALGGSPVSMLCPYDAVTLDAAVLDDACRTHARMIRGGERRTSPSFDSTVASAIFGEPLPPAPAQYRGLVYDHGGLAALRRFVEDVAAAVGFPSTRSEDLLLAANEVATNTLAHVGTPGVLQVWRSADRRELICDFCDDGHITEPLVGRFGPYPAAERGWGLWMVNQLCDLVEMRSGPWGTNIRLHMSMA